MRLEIYANMVLGGLDITWSSYNWGARLGTLDFGSSLSGHVVLYRSTSFEAKWTKIWFLLPILIGYIDFGRLPNLSGLHFYGQ